MLADSISWAIEQDDYLRRPSLRVEGRGRHKEWLHFCCSTAELDLIVNLSISSAPGRETPRLLCAVREAGWDGDVDDYSMDQLSVSTNGAMLRLGDNELGFASGRYRVRFGLRRRPIHVDLELWPRTIPSRANNIDLGTGADLHWFLVPHLLASGEVTVGTRRHRLQHVPAYHDHNWGSFGWGHDYAWVWGHGHGRCETSGVAWTLVFDRLSNRPRTRDLVRDLLVWREARQHRVFGSRQLQIAQHGWLRHARPIKLPRIAGLVRPEHCCDVPQRLCVEARCGDDEVQLVFEPDALCQIVTPNDDDLECTVINEACGRLRVDGRIRGERLGFETRTIFEFLHG